MTVDNFFEIYCSYQKKHYSQRTYSSRTSTIRCHFLTECGPYELGTITSAQIDKVFVNMETEGLQENTIYGCYAALLSFFKLAAEMNQLAPDENPMARVHKIRPDLHR